VLLFVIQVLDVIINIDERVLTQNLSILRISYYFFIIYMIMVQAIKSFFYFTNILRTFVLNLGSFFVN
jgi:hypothetical protein